MDFVEWTGVILSQLIKAHMSSPESRRKGVSESVLTETVFGTETVNKLGFWTSERYEAFLVAISELIIVGLIEEDDHLIFVGHPDKYRVHNSDHDPEANHRIDRNAADHDLLRPSKLALDLDGEVTPLWESICGTNLKPDQAQFLYAVNQISSKCEADYVSLEYATQKDILAKLDWTDGRDLLEVVAYEVEDRGLVRWYKAHEPDAPRAIVARATYKGLVWETRRRFTLESKFIDSLVAEWETTSVDFKRELYLGTADEKAEFVKDVIGLANTQASGRRWLIIGFDDKTRAYHGPPDPGITQNRIEQILAQYTTPVVEVRYEVVDYRAGWVGKLEILRHPKKLPYSVANSIKGRKKQVVQGQIFVRHGSQTEEPTPVELQAIRDESQRD